MEKYDGLEKFLAYGTIGAGLAFGVLFVVLAARRKTHWLTTVAFLLLAFFVIAVGAYLEDRRQDIDQVALECAPPDSITVPGNRVDIIFEKDRVKAFTDKGYRAVASSCIPGGPHNFAVTMTECRGGTPVGAGATMYVNYCRLVRPGQKSPPAK